MNVRITSVASMLERFQGRTIRSQGHMRFGIELRTFLDLMGMRAAATTRASEIKKLGLEW